MTTICLLFVAAISGTGPDLTYARVSPRGGDRVVMESAKSVHGVEWWAEADGVLLVLASDEALLQLGRLGQVTPLDVVPRPQRLIVVSRNQDPPTIGVAFDVLLEGGRVAVVQLRGPLRLQKHGDLSTASHHLASPVQGNLVLSKAPGGGLARRNCTLVEDLVDLVDSSRWFGDVETLASLNRNTFENGVLDARDWLVSQFSAIGGLSVSTQSFMVGNTPAFNVIARMDGTTRPNDWYIVGAHYDTTSENASQAAPGAEDNGSGTAAVVEMARILAQHPPQATVFFICYSGEEQGLHGSDAHAAGLVSNGDADKVQVALIMDMIGYTADADLDCLLETNSSNQFIIDDLSDAAGSYTDLRIETSLFPFGSDHIPYLNRDIPSLLVIENDWDSYPNYHRTTDTPDNISLEMGGEVIKMNLAALAQWTGAAFCDGFFDFVEMWGTPAPDGLDSNGNHRMDVTDMIAADLI